MAGKRRLDVRELERSEVDEVEGLYTWRSVIVHGGFYPLVEGDRYWDLEAWERGVELLRRLDPDILTRDDPVPERDVVFRIAVQEITGRAGRLVDGGGSSG